MERREGRMREGRKEGETEVPQEMERKQQLDQNMVPRRWRSSWGCWKRMQWVCVCVLFNMAGTYKPTVLQRRDKRERVCGWVVPNGHFHAQCLSWVDKRECECVWLLSPDRARCSGGRCPSAEPPGRHSGSWRRCDSDRTPGGGRRGCRSSDRWSPWTE